MEDERAAMQVSQNKRGPTSHMNNPRTQILRGRGRLSVAVAAAAVVALAVPAAGSSRGMLAHAAASPLKVAFLYENSTTDLGWDTAMYQGEVGVKKKYGNKISVTDKVVPDGPQDGTVIKSLIGQGYK